MLKAFDRKFGEAYLKTVPTQPGVYRVFAESGALIYVGKSKNLRRRIGQYRNAKRRKKHAKMKTIVAEAARIEFETCASDLEALLLENRLIQAHRPKWNVAGAFHFLYPMIGVHFQQGYVFLCCTTSPQLFPEFRFHGSYRSRSTTREAFRSLGELIRFVGTPVPRSRIFGKEGYGKRDRYSEVHGFRGLPASWLAQLEDFLRGDSKDAIESLVLSLVESPVARRSSRVVQQNLNWLKYFWRHEALRLKELRRVNGSAGGYPIPQAERDRLFLISSNRERRLHRNTDHVKGSDETKSSPSPR